MNFRLKSHLSRLLILPFMVLPFVFASCIHIHHNKFGKELNEERMKLGIPIIKSGWQRDAVFYYPAPANYTSWFTDSRPKDLSLPYHAYKTIYYLGDTLVAERDTYLNMNFKWFKDGKEVNSANDTLRERFKKYHALDVIYVYRQLDAHEKNFTSFPSGFSYELMGEKNGFADIQHLTGQQAEEILKRWNLKRLNY